MLSTHKFDNSVWRKRKILLELFFDWTRCWFLWFFNWINYYCNNHSNRISNWFYCYRTILLKELRIWQKCRKKNSTIQRFPCFRPKNEVKYLTRMNWGRLKKEMKAKKYNNLLKICNHSKICEIHRPFQIRKKKKKPHVLWSTQFIIKNRMWSKKWIVALENHCNLNYY